MCNMVIWEWILVSHSSAHPAGRRHIMLRPPEPNYSRTAHISSLLSPSLRLDFTRRHLFNSFHLFMTDSPCLETWKKYSLSWLDHAKSRYRPPRIAMQWRVGPVYSFGARDIADCNQLSCNTGFNIQSQLFKAISNWDQNALCFIN